MRGRGEPSTLFSFGLTSTRLKNPSPGLVTSLVAWERRSFQSIREVACLSSVIALPCLAFTPKPGEDSALPARLAFQL